MLPTTVFVYHKLFTVYIQTSCKFSCKSTIFDCFHLTWSFCVSIVCWCVGWTTFCTFPFISSLFGMLIWAFVFIFHISPVVVSGWGLGWLLIGCLLFLSVVCCRLWVVCCLLTVSCLLMVVVCCLSAVAWWLCHQVGWQTASQVWPSPNRWPTSFPSTLSSSVAVVQCCAQLVLDFKLRTCETHW